MRARRAAAILLALIIPTPAAGQVAPAARNASATGPSGAPVAREIAITFDDLPVASSVWTGVEDQARITAELLRALTRNAVPAVGFVNESKLETDGELDGGRVALLRRWIDAGLELGNHTYSHADLHLVPLAQFERDVLRGEVVTRRLLEAAGSRPRFFRHPYLHTGRDTETRAALERFLARHGYRVAPVTMDNYDYVFAAAYDRAAARSDAEAQRRILRAYLDYMGRVVAYYEQQSTALFGRDVRHVLLLHANALNAAAFDALARRLAERGYRFITLARALEDPAYGSPDRYTGPGGITWLHRWALTQGHRGSFFAGEPEVPAWVQAAAAGAELSSSGAGASSASWTSWATRRRPRPGSHRRAAKVAWCDERRRSGCGAALWARRRLRKRRARRISNSRSSRNRRS